MGKHDNLLLGRVGGAYRMCEDLRMDMTRSRSTRFYARIAAWALVRLMRALKDSINGV